MISFHNISSIAKYERKTLFRSWFFRIFSILSLGVLFFMNMGMVSEVGSNMWVFRAIPSSIPYMNLLILNVAQAIIAVFLASDFLKRDKKLDTTEVIYMRSMTNGDYVIGKTLGNMQVFMILNFAVLGMALIFNSIASGTHIPWSSYLIYILLISIPTLVYIMGLSFLLMSLIRNQAVTFVIILGYIGITLFLVQGSYYYVFDYMSFNIPMLRSGIIGFGNLDLILGHRGIYFCLGTGFIFLTIFLLKRLPQSESMTWFSIVFSFIFIVAGTFLAYRHVSKFILHDRLRAEAILLNNHYVKLPSGDVARHHLKVIHKGTEIEASSQMTVVNNNRTDLDSLVFHLNPGLIITEAKLNGQAVTPIRKEQLIILPLDEPMNLIDSVVVNMSYSGRIREEFCYLDIDNEKRSEKYQELFVINVDKRYAFITPDYLLLTRESGWYPETGVTYSSEDFGWNRMHFTDFHLEVETDTALYAVSQGAVTRTAPGQFSFSPEQPLTQISLAIGKYRHKSMESAGTEFGIWYLEGHDFFSDALPEIKDTIPALVQESFRDFLRTYNLRYPFKRLSIVEVPSQFKSFMRTWTFQQEVVQPEQIFLQEKGFLMRDIDVKTQIKREKRWMEREGQSLTDKDFQVRAVGNIMGNFFREGGRPNFRRQGGNMQVIENSNPYFIFPQLYYFSYSVRSSDWPVMNLVLEAYLKSQSNDMRSAFMRDRTGLSEDEMANIALQDRSFEELLADDKQVKLIDNLVKLKGDALFTAIQAKAGETEFTTFLRDILRENKFTVLNFDTLDARLNAQFGISMEPYMNNWFRDKKMPGFLFTPITAVNTKAGDQIRTMISFSASNTGESDGVVKLTFRLGGPGGGGRPRGMSMGRGPGGGDDNINKILTLKPGESKKVSYLFDNEPRGLTINTLTSKNIPQTLMQFFGKVEEDQKVEPKEGEETTHIPVSVLQPNEIVVDNEDPGFTYTKNDKTSLLHKIIIKEEDTGLKYSGYNDWHPPLNWTNTTNSGYYGLFVRSAFYVKSGTGDQKATWTIPVKESGHYDVYTHIYPMIRGGRMRGPDGGGGDGEKGEYHYFITHNDGETEQTLQVDRAEPGWNSLGSFYLSPGKATVVLTNTSQLKIVVADAIKVVKN